MSIFEFDDQQGVRTRGTLRVPGATPGDVLTVGTSRGTVTPSPGGGSQPDRFTKTMAEVLFTERVGQVGTYSASIAVPAGTIIDTIRLYNLANFFGGGFAGLDVGDTLNGPQAYLAGVSVFADGDGTYDPAAPGVNGLNWATLQAYAGNPYTDSSFSGKLVQDCINTGENQFESSAFDGPGIRYAAADEIMLTLTGADGTGTGGIFAACIFGYGVPAEQIAATFTPA